MRSKRRDGVRGGKQSGLGREGGPEGLQEYRQLKYLAVPGLYTSGGRRTARDHKGSRSHAANGNVIMDSTTVRSDGARIPGARKMDPRNR